MSIMTLEPIATSRSQKNHGRDRLRFHASDITGTQVSEVSDIDPGVSVALAAKSLAARMELPANVPWALRDDRSGNYLDDQRSLGGQIESGAQLTMVPKTHLG